MKEISIDLSYIENNPILKKSLDFAIEISQNVECRMNNEQRTMKDKNYEKRKFNT